MQIDNRIIPMEKLEPNNMVLVDNHSLSVLADEIESTEVPSITLKDLMSRGGITI